MDGHRYERVQRPSFPWASVAEFAWANQFPVCHLGNHIFQQQAKRKTSNIMNSQWITKPPTQKTCKVIWDVESLSILLKRTKNNFQFVLIRYIWLTPTTTCDKLVEIWPWCMQAKWKSVLILIMHRRITCRNPTETNVNRNPPWEHWGTLNRVLRIIMKNKNRINKWSGLCNT